VGEGWPARLLFAISCLIGLAVGLSMAGVPVTAQGPARQTAPEEPEVVRYEVRIRGRMGESLRTLLGEVSETRRLSDRPPSNFLRLRRRAEADRDRLLQALRSRGYYDGAIEVRYDRGRDPVQVIFEVEPGAVYRLREIRLEVDPPNPELRVPAPGELGLKVGQPAQAQAIIDAEGRFLQLVRGQGFPLAELGERRAVVDHDADAMDITLRLRPGPQVRFGDVRYTGIQGIEESYVRNRLPWKPGQLITPARLEEARQALIDTQLFSTAQIRVGQEVEGDGRLPVTVEVTQRKQRSIEVGVRYRTDEGPGGNIGWEHRNLFGGGENLGVTLDASGIGYFLSGEFREPDVLARNQTFVASGQAAAQDTDAYTSNSIGGLLGFERILEPGVTGSLGIAYRFADIEQEGESERFGLLSLPAGLNVDKSNNLLNPTDGYRVLVSNEPFVDTLGTGVVFNKTRVDHTRYLQVLDDPGVVLAGRIGFGTMFGADRDEIPADERFYAGGGGSVRGFGFQLAGPLNADDDPIGGRSLLELSAEVRMRFTETIGGVVFVDAGSAFESTLPDFDPALRVGTGLGLRYFSPVGPLRLDIGFPINRRAVDDAFQLYISIGQAF
jgi:translocation and assembly module TamA